MIQPAHAEAWAVDWEDAMAEHDYDDDDTWDQVWADEMADAADEWDDGQLVITCLRCGWPWPGICTCKSEGGTGK